jgi:Carboxypeptidase regulatory-like domain
MKYFAAMSFAIMLAVFPCAGQQTIDPAANSHVKDNATFGNQKSPKKEKAPTSRTVTGQVTDGSGQVLEGALVTLTDKKTNEKTNFFTKKDGRYRFEELSFNNDYEVQARYKDKASPLRKLSQFDTTPNPVRILEIDLGSNPASASAADKNSNAPKQ